MNHSTSLMTSSFDYCQRDSQGICSLCLFANFNSDGSFKLYFHATKRKRKRDVRCDFLKNYIVFDLLKFWKNLVLPKAKKTYNSFRAYFKYFFSLLFCLTTALQSVRFQNLFGKLNQVKQIFHQAKWSLATIHVNSFIIRDSFLDTQFYSCLWRNRSLL